MSESQCFLSWDSYENNICNGFAEMQQRQELVDMTLVAEGHLVKVHKNLISLASPFIKELILTVPCDHPIIFLNNVSHDILCYLLEYIYTGEVKVELDKLQALLNVANDLQLYGLQKTTLQQNKEKSDCNSQTNVNPGLIADFAQPENSYWQSISQNNSKNDALRLNEQENEMLDQKNDYTNIKDLEYITDLNGATYITKDKIDNYPHCAGDEPSTDINTITIDSTGSLPQQYSVSNRGSLQLILNRFIYYMHHQALCGRRRRWRCINYRRTHCPAYVDTMDETITSRKNAHTHQHHDDKIIKKIRSNQVYGNLQTTIHGVDTITEQSKKRRKINTN